MTLAEVEAKLERLSEQLSLAHKQHENRNKNWLLIGILSLFCGVGYAIAGLIVLLFASSMMGSALMLTATPLIFLGLVLFVGANKMAMPVAETSAHDVME
jgi:Na+/melibiose symporter-like transporter